MNVSVSSLSEISSTAHAIPYVPLVAGKTDKDLEAYKKFGLLNGNVERDAVGKDYQPLCLYGFPNYPDGALHTSVNQLARFPIAFVNQGTFGGARILDAETVRLMLTRENVKPAHQGLCWVSSSSEGQTHWLHNGSDPGIFTKMSFRVSDGVGVIVFVNRSDLGLHNINYRLFQKAGEY